MDANADPFKKDYFVTYKPIGGLKAFKKVFRKLDLYALPVTLRYKGEKKFYTNYGAVTSLLIVLLMLTYLYTEVMRMLDRSQYTSTETVFTVIERDSATGAWSYDNIVEMGTYVDMTFGIRAMHQNGTDFNDSSYFTFDFKQREAVYSTFLSSWTET